MKKFVMFTLVFIAVFNCFDLKFFAENLGGAKVYLRVEGIENTVMQGEVEAETAIQALQILGKENNINVILKTNVGKQEVYSIDNITNDKFSKSDGWNICIFRKNELIVNENIENMKLLNGDEIVIYYGYKNITPVEIDVVEEIENNILKLQVSHKISKWILDDKKWKLEIMENYLENVKVHLKSKNIVQTVYESVYETDEIGMAEFEVKKPNIYTYFLEGYKKTAVPSMVKTKERTIVIGVDKNEKLTRAKMVALLINYYGIESEKSDKTVDIEKIFKDVKLDCEYREYLELAWSKGIIKGNGDFTFRPDDEITFQELMSILDNIFLHKKEENVEVLSDTLQDCDDWAVSCIGNAIKKGIIKNKRYNWTKSVDLENLIELLFN